MTSTEEQEIEELSKLIVQLEDRYRLLQRTNESIANDLFTDAERGEIGRMLRETREQLSIRTNDLKRKCALLGNTIRTLQETIQNRALIVDEIFTADFANRDIMDVFRTEHEKLLLEVERARAQF